MRTVSVVAVAGLMLAMVSMPSADATAVFTYSATYGVNGVSGYSGPDFSGPRGITIDGWGNLWVTDSTNRVQEITPAGAVVLTLGTSSTVDSNQFNYPFDVAVDGAGYVYVADEANSRVLKFDHNGVYQYTIGVTRQDGTDDGHLAYPRGVSVGPGGFVYVADTVNNRIQVFGPNGVYSSTIGATGANTLNFPTGVAVDASGNVYVADTNNNRVLKFKANGDWLMTLGNSGGAAGSDDSHFNHPWGVEVDASGNIYVADTNNHRIQKFSSSGQLVASLSYDPNDTNVQFSWPQGVALNTVTGDLYVSDTGHNRVQKFTQTITPDTTPPTASVTAPTSAWELGSKTTVKWSAVDAGSGIKSIELRSQSAAPNGPFGSWKSQAFGPSTRQTSVAVSPGYTYCFSVRATDRDGNVSAWSPSRCTRAPLDDRALNRSWGWMQIRSVSAYKGTLAKATAKGSSLTRPNARFSRIALVATKCPTCGTMAIKVGGKLFKTISLYAPNTKVKQVVVLPALKLRTAAVSIVVVSSGKPVIIDGLGISSI